MTTLGDYRESFETMSFERGEDGVLVVRLHSADGGPYVWGGEKIHDEMTRAPRDISSDAGNEVVIITGSGKWFTGPPAEPGGHTAGGPDYLDRSMARTKQMLSNWLGIPAPVICCLNGPAHRHAEIPLLAGDIVLATDDASIVDTAHFATGKVPGDGIAILMMALLGPSRARYFHWMGQRLSAPELKDLGLVHEILPRDRLLPRAHEIAARLLQAHPLVRRYTRRVFAEPLERQLNRYLGEQFALESLATLGEASDRLGLGWT
jgi:enoyl-CoA hydratase/carnithine racemase